jgi:hypothetical protein
VSVAIDIANKAFDTIVAQNQSFAAASQKPLMKPPVFTASNAVLNTMSSKYDQSSALYSTNNPSTGTTPYTIEFRSNWTNYQNNISNLNPLYKQQQMYMVDVYANMANLKSGAASAMDPNTINNGRNALTQATSYTGIMVSLQSSIYSYIDQANTVVNAVQIGFAIYYAVSICCVGLMVLGGLFLSFCKCDRCTCISCIGWIILAVLMMIGFLFSTLVFPASVVFIDACNEINPDTLKTDRGIIPANYWVQLATCFQGNGDLYTQYNLNSQIGFAKNMSDALSNATALYNTTTQNPNYPIDDNYIGNCSYIENNSPDQASQNLINNQSLLNSLSNSNNCMGDLVVWNQSMCGTTPLLTSAADAQGKCVVIIYLTTSANSSLFLGSRYQSVLSFSNP